MPIRRRHLLASAPAALLAPQLFAPRAFAADAAEPVRIGLILPMTGPFASTGKQISSAVNLCLQQHGGTAAGRRLEVLLRDDAGVPDNTRRLAQELVVNDKVTFLAGFGLTPLALAAAPIATRAKVPMIIMAAATAMITEQSPFIVRTSVTVPQYAALTATWAAQNGMKKMVSLVTDYGPGIDAETWFKKGLLEAGGTLAEAMRVPLANPDFAPFLQRARDAAPDAIFAFVPSGVGAVLMRQFAERGLPQAGIKMIAMGDVTDDDILNSMGDAVLGMVTTHQYSAAHDSAVNKAYVAAFRAANNNMRPNFMSVHGYDGATLIIKALEAAGADADGEKLVAAMKGMAWESPRGPVQIDPATREMIQNIYVRRVERVNGELYNVEFATYPAVHDPAKVK